MKIPVKNGRTSLAYVTDEERKLLRRRDAVKGSPNKKMSYGIPKLAPESDYMMELEREKELRAKEDALRAAGFKETYAGGLGDYEWVHAGKKLLAGIPGSPTAPAPASSKPLGVDYKDWGADTSKPKPAPKPAPAPAPTATPSSGGGGKPKPRPKPTRPPAEEIETTPTPTPETETPETDTTTTIDTTQLQEPMLDEIVADGVNSELLETRLANLINKNSALFKAATTKTMQAMAARGLVNSSIAEEAVMSAILAVAMPIAERDANAYMNQRMQNQAYSNEFRTAQNKAYYESFLMKLQGSIDKQLRELMEQSANWRAVLAARSNITTTPGMDADAAEAGMDAVTPDWWKQ